MASGRPCNTDWSAPWWTLPALPKTWRRLTASPSSMPSIGRARFDGHTTHGGRTIIIMNTCISHIFKILFSLERVFWSLSPRTLLEILYSTRFYFSMDFLYYSSRDCFMDGLNTLLLLHLWLWSIEVGFLNIGVLIICILVRMFGAAVVSFCRTLSIPIVSFAAWNIATSTRGA